MQERKQVKQPYKKYSSLAQFVSATREALGLTRDELADKSSLDIKEIQNIEEGFDMFLSTTTRQKLAKGLKVENKEIKRYEKTPDFNLANQSTMEDIKERILNNMHNPNFTINCPLCGQKLITRVAKLYDLEDNLILRPKSRCSKCPFQLTD